MFYATFIYRLLFLRKQSLQKRFGLLLFELYQSVSHTVDKTSNTLYVSHQSNTQHKKFSRVIYKILFKLELKVVSNSPNKRLLTI